MGLNILVVGSPHARQHLRQVVGVSGLAVASVMDANDGREALGLAQERKFDFILAHDVPETTGHPEAGWAAAGSALGIIPVLFLSAEGGEMRMEFLVRLGVRAYLNGPLTGDALRETVCSVLGLEAIH